MTDYRIRALGPADGGWLAPFMEQHWGGPSMVVHGQVYDLREQPGFVAEADGAVVGLITYRLEPAACEVLSLDSLRRGAGIGGALLERVAALAQASGCARLWLITTNDNTDALRFYQRRGFTLAALHREAVTRARALKPTIPLLGDHGIPIRDELELERRLG